MSGDDSSRQDRRTERDERSHRGDRDGAEARAEPRDGTADGTRPTREESGDDGGTEDATGSDDGGGTLEGIDASDTFEGLPVSGSVVGNFASVLVAYGVLGFSLAFTGVILLNLYGGTVEFGKAFLGFGTIAFLALVGPVLGGPMGLWAQEQADGELLSIPAAFLANAIGHFFMAFIAAIFLAVEFEGLQLVDLLFPFFFAAFFAGLMAAVTAGLGSAVTRVLS
ncbi:hypothetical protein BRD00_09170 [Halobacteriales archaeon QS_8_69_26]|nr:MAG: hypothetical protein BRD00_09170 [Halobacteriales archaeon QS_8_69_26]